MSVDTRGGICLKIEGVPYQTVDWNKIEPVAPPTLALLSHESGDTKPFQKHKVLHLLVGHAAPCVFLYYEL